MVAAGADRDQPPAHTQFALAMPTRCILPQLGCRHPWTHPSADHEGCIRIRSFGHGVAD
jgi:hypothetical protein